MLFGRAINMWHNNSNKVEWEDEFRGWTGQIVTEENRELNGDRSDYEITSPE